MVSTGQKPESQGQVRRYTLREFKVRQLVRLKALERELSVKHPDRAGRLEEVVRTLEAKLYNLRVYTLFDYLMTISLAAREFPELGELFPSPEEVEGLLAEREQE